MLCSNVLAMSLQIQCTFDEQIMALEMRKRMHDWVSECEAIHHPEEQISSYLQMNQLLKQSNGYVNSEELVKELKEVHRWNN